MLRVQLHQATPPAPARILQSLLDHHRMTFIEHVAYVISYKDAITCENRARSGPLR